MRNIETIKESIGFLGCNSTSLYVIWFERDCDEVNIMQIFSGMNSCQIPMYLYEIYL